MHNKAAVIDKTMRILLLVRKSDSQSVIVIVSVHDFAAANKGRVRVRWEAADGSAGPERAIVWSCAARKAPVEGEKAATVASASMLLRGSCESDCTEGGAVFGLEGNGRKWSMGVKIVCHTGENTKAADPINESTGGDLAMLMEEGRGVERAPKQTHSGQESACSGGFAKGGNTVQTCPISKSSDTKTTWEQQQQTIEWRAVIRP